MRESFRIPGDIFASGKCDMLLRSMKFPASREVKYPAAPDVIVTANLNDGFKQVGFTNHNYEL